MSTSDFFDRLRADAQWVETIQVSKPSLKNSSVDSSETVASMMQRLNRDDFAIIGREAIERNLPLVREIIADRIDRLSKCSFWNVARIPELYTPGMDRRLFVAAVLMLYHPHDLDKKKFLLKKKLPAMIAETLSMHSGNTSKLIQNVILRLRVYEEFRDEARQYIETLKLESNESSTGN